MSETPPPDVAVARRPLTPRLCGAASIAIGVMVLAGWALEIEALKCVFPGLIAMKPNAALGFVLAGGALGVLRNDRRGNRLAAWLAASVATIGALTSFEYLSGLSLGIDQLLFRMPPGTVGRPQPGRMHPTTAMDFTAIGVALVFIAGDRNYRAAHSLILMAALVAGSTLIGYIYGVRQFVGMAAYNQMALHTTIGMLALSVGSLTARPGRGLTAVITGDTTGSQTARRLLPVAVLLPIILNGTALLFYQAQIFDESYVTAVRVVATIAIFVACIVGNAHALNRADRDRLQVEGRYRFLAEAMPQIVWTASPDGSVYYMNRRWSELTGQDREHYQGRGWEGAIHPDDLSRFQDCWGRASRDGLGYEIEYRLRNADGSYRWHMRRAAPMRDESGLIIQWVGNCTDVHDRKLAGEQRFRSLVEATSAIVWNTPASGEFEADQPGWSAFTGQPYDRLKGWGWLDAIHPEDRAETARVWSDAVAGRMLYQVEHRLRRHDGVYRHMAVRAVPLLSEGGTICEWVGVHTDVDNQKQAESALRVAKEAAEAATRAKGEFLANMSHEIRTPMNGILGMTELALDTELTSRQREYLDTVKSSAESLLTVINDILDFSRIEAGKLRLDLVPFSLRGCVEETIRSLAVRAHGKGLELACRFAPGLPDALAGDPDRLRQVVVNLVGNAIKFTGHGEVVFTVGQAEVGDGIVLEFTVSDTGIGIPEEKLGLIFEPFEQADGSTTRRFGGTGLGLAISSRLVDLMGGRITAESEPGRGSTFRFTARFDRSADDTDCRESPSMPRLEDLPVLVVDDNATNRRILEEILTSWGARPVTAACGPAALEMLRAATGRGAPFAAALIDGMMPGMDGLDLAGAIRAEPAIAATALLLLTSAGRPEDTPLYRTLGIAACLTKPARQSDLFDALIRALAPGGETDERRGRRGEKSRPGNLTGRGLRVLLVEDHPVNQKVAAHMLEKLGHSVSVVGDGRQALEALGAGEFDLVLMDLQMPVMDGFEAVREVREREARGAPRVPVVALTAHAMKGDRERCLAAGFDGYLSKPVREAELRDVVASFAAADPGRPGLRTAPVGETCVLTPDSLVAGLVARCGGDEEFAREVLEAFLEATPRSLEAIATAAEAGDLPRLSAEAHGFKGASLTVGADDLADDCRELEEAGRRGDLAGARAAAGMMRESWARVGSTLASFTGARP